MVLKYENEIIIVNKGDSLKITVIGEYDLKYNTKENYMLIENENRCNRCNSLIGRFQFEDLKLAEKLIKDIQENYKNDIEFYNIKTRIEELKQCKI